MDSYLKYINTGLLLICALGIWKIALNKDSQSVYIKGGRVQASVDGSVEIENTVDVNLHRINGYNAFYDYNGNGKYERIPVMTGNPYQKFEPVIPYPQTVTPKVPTQSWEDYKKGL